MDSSLRRADTRKRALWDEAHAPRRPTVRPFLDLTSGERDAVHRRWDDLVVAAAEARRTGWHHWERDPEVAAVRAAGLTGLPASFANAATSALAFARSGLRITTASKRDFV